MELKIIIDELIKLDINIQLQDGNLLIKGPEENISDDILNAVKENKEKLINYLKSVNHNGYQPSDIPVVKTANNYPLSSAQRRLWVLSQFEEGNVAYNMPEIYVFEGILDLKILSRSFEVLIARHEILRTVFRKDDSGHVRQFILAPEAIGFKLSFADLSGAENADEAVQRRVQAEINTPFNLSEGPLLRAGLCQLSTHKWVFTYVMHHIISDGWSMNVLIKELLLIYKAETSGSGYALPPLRIQYKDYAVWQQEQLYGEALYSHQTYWLKQFEGELPVLNLPTDKPRPAVKTYHGSVVRKKIPAHLQQQFKELLFEAESTLFMGLLSAVNVLLYRYSGQEDIIIGSPVAGREHTDLEVQLGFYVSTLALRSRFGGADSFRSLLSATKTMTLDAFAHQAYPFDELVDELSLQRDLSRNALFDVMVVLHNQDTDVQDNIISDLKLSAYEDSIHQVGKFDLTFHFTEYADGLAVGIEYNSDLYMEATVNRMGNHFIQLLEALTLNPSLPITNLQYLNEQEIHELQNGFNNRSMIYPADKTIIDLFENQVRLTPERTALVYENRNVSYEELNALANQLADYLHQHYHIQPNDLVGIYLERSEWLLIAILGVLKSGGAYVPVDPDYPNERVAYIFADSNCKLVINAAELELFSAATSGYSKENRPITTGTDNLAYVIYTSGSTGMPKGCTITHHNVYNYIRWASDFYESSGNFGLFTSVSFDLTVTSIFCPLTKGGRLSIYKQQDELAAILIDSFSEQSGIDSIKLTPSHINLLRHLQLSSSTISCAIVGGEEVTADHVKILKAINPAIKIYNEYGPTETTVGCVAKELDENTTVVIGKPIAGTAIYIIGEQHMLCPVGVAGEICVAGAGVSPGYLNNEEMTAEKFINNPFIPGEKMYLTGDLGRWLANGELDYLGRKDDQVKLRGYRIELGEIEATLRDYPQVNSAVVIVGIDGAGDKELIAYLESSGDLDLSAIRTYLLNRLPAYMLPAHYIKLDALPFTSNGKIDKRLLPAPEGLGLNAGVEYVEARTDAEEKLVKIWKEVLGRERIGVHDNFFELGGNSMKIINMITLINRNFAKILPITMAFRFSNISALSAYLTNDEEEGDAVASNEELNTSVNTMEETFSLINYDTDED